MDTQTIHQQLISGQTWEQFCDHLKRCGAQILRPETPADPATRAEGYRYLTRLLRIALEMHLEFADPAFPSFFRTSHETAKIGADNPDNIYEYARLNGKLQYRISGNRGSVSYLSIATQKGGYETDGRMTVTGFIDASRLQTDANGDFELIVSTEPQPGNWLPMEDSSVSVLVRQTFMDRKSEVPAQLKIERIGAAQAPGPLAPEMLAQALQRASGFVENTAKLFADWTESYLPHSNQLPPANQAVCQAAGGDPNIFYYHSHWALAEDEALVIHVDQVPACDFWNLQINNYWMESLDYRYHRICINKHQAQYDARGGMTLVLSERDPGVPNWLQTAGVRQGTMCLRWVGAATPCHPTTRVVPMAELASTLAAPSPAIAMNTAAAPSLNVDDLLQAARERCPGLSHFGDDNYHQALHMLTQALNTEAKLSPVGMAMMRERLVGQLANRLVMEGYFQRHPEIADIAIDNPLVIVGLPRTGTTMLQRTLAVDPRFYSAAWWETRYPAPLSSEGATRSDQRIALAQQEVEQTVAAIPQILAIHPLSATLCDEEFMLMEHSFLCAMDAYADVPSYTQWLDQQDQRPVYEQLKKMLQFLQWQKAQRGEAQEGQRWLLKAPQHLHTLELLLDVFPQAQVILTHREPAQTIPSMASMAHTLWHIYSDQPSARSAGQQWNSRMARGIAHTMQVRSQNNPARFLDIHFADTVKQPMQVLERVYAFADMPFTAQARASAQQWLDSNGREKRAAHDYSLETFGLSEAQMQADYAAYRARHLSEAV